MKEERRNRKGSGEVKQKEKNNEQRMAPVSEHEKRKKSERKVKER